jgi:hypothetical protein
MGQPSTVPAPGGVLMPSVLRARGPSAHHLPVATDLVSISGDRAVDASELWQPER